MSPATFSEATGFLGEDRLRQVIDTALDGMVLIDSSGTVLLYDAPCEKLFGYSAQEVLSKNVKFFAPHPYRRNHDAYIRNCLRSGEAKIIGIGRVVSGRRKDCELIKDDDVAGPEGRRALSPQAWKETHPRWATCFGGTICGGLSDREVATS